jgi:hypothetical protein
VFANISFLNITDLAAFNLSAQLEDPFYGNMTLDGINVDKELGPIFLNHLLVLRKRIVPDNSVFKKRKHNLYERVSLAK